MIKTFRNKGLKAFAETGQTRRLSLQNSAARIGEILNALDAATKPSDMDRPGYHFHSLGQMAPGRFSVRVTGNWRITFAWDAGATDVDLEDYH